MTTILLTWVGEEGREAVSTGVQHPTDGRAVLRCWIGRFDYCFCLSFPTQFMCNNVPSFQVYKICFYMLVCWKIPWCVSPADTRERERRKAVIDPV